jgi:DNA-binding GntR family transcriptional regulator
MVLKQNGVGLTLVRFKLGAAPLTKKETASAQAFEILRDGILGQRLLPGTHLTEAGIAQELGISTTPVREALHRLVQQGLVDRRTTRGVEVHTITAQDIQEIFEMRALLEPEALRKGFMYFKEKDIDTLSSILSAARKALDQHDFAALAAHNARFHAGLVSKVPNSVLLRWIGELSDKHRLISIHGWRIVDHSHLESQEHQEILGAVRQGNGEKAARMLEQHIRAFMTRTLAAQPRGAR